MSIIRDLYYLLKDLLSFALAPVRYRESKLASLEAIRLMSRQSFEERYGDLDTLFAGEYEGRTFLTFMDMLQFVCSCLEENDPARLAASISDFRKRLEHDPGYSVYFLEGIFDQLASVHRDLDLRKRFADYQFPDDENELRVGVPGIMGLEFSFHTRGEAWAIRDIYLVR